MDSVDGHHAYLKVDGISVEHHFAFSNTKVKDGLIGPEAELQQLVVTNPQASTMQGINYPNHVFTSLFVGWHAYEHFLQEKIELRHVIDWALALHQLSEKEAETLNVIKNNTGWGKFVDSLTAIAVHQIGLPQEWLHVNEQAYSEHAQRVWDDIINSPHTPKSKSSNFRRIYIAKRMLKSSWKFKEYSNISATKLLYKETVGHFKTKKSLTFNQ